MTDSALLIGADRATKEYLASLLSEHGHEPVLAGSQAEALAALAHTRFAFTVLDLRHDGSDGRGLLDALTSGGDAAPVIALADSEPADAPMRLSFHGADRVLQDPLTPARLENAIKDVLSRPRLSETPVSASAARLQQEIGLWRSPRMREVWEVIQRAARVNVTVLISGETGTGKDLVARAIHHLSPRHSAPFVPVNCAAVPRDLLESELFGHEKGAFTGAHQLKTGKFESANGGTIFLDEIGDLHPALQAKLLHVLQDGTFSRVGGRSPIHVDVRVLAATNRDLARAVAAERFRDDLYYRLNVIDIVVPALRERREDVPALAHYFVQRYSKLYQREDFELGLEAMERLTRHRYPGNVRELENVIKRMLVLGDSTLSRAGFPSRLADTGTDSVEPNQPPAVFLKDIARKATHAAERETILKMLEQTNWNRVRAAKLLNISYRSLLYKLKRCGLDRTPPVPGSGA